MVAIIKSDPYKRYKAIKIIFQTPLVAKCVVARRDSGASYVMVIAPTKDKSGNPNQVKDRVTNLLELDHPGVVRVFEAYEFDGYCYAIMNDWTEFNHGAFGLTTLTEEQVATSIHKMTASLSYLQEMDIILGCISIEEMRFTRYLEDVENDYVDILIIDLGISRHVDPKRYVELHQNRRYAEPPEARDGVFTKYSDVWTLGSITYHLLTGDVSTEHLLERIHFNLEERLQDVSRDARNFCLSCLKVVPEERLSLKEAMNHPWFQKYRIKLRKSIVASKSTSKLLSDISNSEENERTGTNFLKRASKIVAKHLEDDEIEEYKLMFDAIDVDNTGFITHDEFISVLKTISKLPDDALVRFLEVDDDQTGKISFSEFLSAILRASGNIDESILIKAFHTMDPSGTGFINVSDLCDLWQDITFDESREMLYEVIGHHEMAEPMLNQRQFIDAFSIKGKKRTSWLSRLIR